MDKNPYYRKKYFFEATYPITFGQLPIGAEFLFSHELKFAKMLGKYFSKKIPYIFTYIKTSDTGYSSNQIWKDLRKAAFHRPVKKHGGFSYEESEVRIIKLPQYEN